VVTLSRLPFLYPEIAEIDLNPVFVRRQGVVIGDVRIIRRQGGLADEHYLPVARPDV
jgi:hypothetical protein